MEQPASLIGALNSPHDKSTDERQSLETKPISRGTGSSNPPLSSGESAKWVVLTWHQMLPEIGREPTPEELAEKLAMPLDKLHKVLAIARRPIRMETEDDPLIPGPEL